MTTHELLELAALDALGLLDDDERESFEAAFRAAPPALQAQIRLEQARMARADALLPDVDAPATLRARVLAAVREAIEAVSRSNKQRQRLAMALLPARGVNPMWRAAAVGALAASVVLGLTTIQMREQFQNVGQLVRSDMQSQAWAEQYGAQFERRLMDPGTQFVKFARVAADAGTTAGSAAVLMLDESSKTGQLLVSNLPDADGEYTLAITDAQGNVRRAVLTFKSTGGKISQRVTGLELQESESLMVLAPSESGSAEPVLKSTN